MLRVIIMATLLVSITLLCAQKKELNYQLSGFLEFDHISYAKSIDDKKNSRNQSILQLELKAPIQNKNYFFSAVEIWDDQSDKSRNRVFLDECYFKIPLSNFDIQIGKQIINWGKADGINPTNNFNPIDYSDLMDTDDETIGLYSLNAKYYYKNWALQGLLSPVFTPGILPISPESRWNMDVIALLAQQNGIDNYIPDYIGINSPANDFSSAQYGFNLSNTIGGFDFELNYYNGYNPIPSASILEVSPINEQMDTFKISLEQIYHKMEVIGGGLATSLGKLGLRGEAAYFMPHDIIVDNPFVRYVIGVDATLTNLIGSNNLFIICQWIQEIHEDGVEYAYYDFNHLFQKTLMTRLEFDLGYTGKITFQALYNFNNDDYYLKPALEMNVANGLNIDVIYDIFEGKQQSFFGYYEDNDRLQIKLKYNF